MQQRSAIFNRLLFGVLFAYLLITSSVEFWNIAWGTGEWLGQFSPTWCLIFLLFSLFCIISLIGVGFALFNPKKLDRISHMVLAVRRQLGFIRWILIPIILLFTVWFLQYTAWGLIVEKPYLRLLMWGLSAVLLGYLLTGENEQVLGLPSLLTSLLLTAATFTLASALSNVKNYPFSLGWSEGNRLWDYSVLFGRHHYNYPADKPIEVLLDIGRQFVGGIPFLIPRLTIWQARLWVALTNIVPYLLLGWIAYYLPKKTSSIYWILAGIWASTFVEQGPIHPPLLLCAIAVAFAWRKPLWLAIPLIMLASYFAVVSRFTWLFAPGIWAGMLELSGTTLQDGRLGKTAWIRTISVGIAGVIGGYFAPFFVPTLIDRFHMVIGQSGPKVVSSLGTGVTLSAVETEATSQALLWYRLFPNATYDSGILIGLFLAVAPLIVVLVYLAKSHRWVMNIWQKLAISVSLLAFLVVGLIVSVKIGGGGDLHNMDMFIIGMMFAGALAWHNGGHDVIMRISTAPAMIRVVMILLIVLPAYYSLMSLRPTSIHEDMSWVMTLADISPAGPLPELLPSEHDTRKALDDIRNDVESASLQGDVLFMDQRQLLTFGYVKNVPLIPEYDKKVLINKAMSADAQYFSAFYKDLAAHRFSLIITNPLNENIQTDLNGFGEENNAWVTWVSTPVLCYYEPLNTMKKVKVQLLIPRHDVSNCDQKLPVKID